MLQWREWAATHLKRLTSRQVQVMEMVLAGHPSKNIAAALGISQRTVTNHHGRIMKRTGIQLFVRACAVGADCGGRRVGAAGRAFRRGIGPSRRLLTVHCDLSARRGFVGHFCSIDQIHDIYAFRERRLSYLWRRCEPSGCHGTFRFPRCSLATAKYLPCTRSFRHGDANGDPSSPVGEDDLQKLPLPKGRPTPRAAE